MALESEIPFVPKSAPFKLRPVLTGAYDEKCSVKFFRDFLPDSEGCEEISSKRQWGYHLRAFCSQPVNSIQQKILAFLFKIEQFMPNNSVFVQFWAPVTMKDGKRTLSVSKQPFAAMLNWKGLCRYRYYCQELCRLDNGREVGPYFGPVGRAFTRGSVEFSPQLGNYSEEDFPFKNHAQHCGFSGYLALPLFEQGKTDDDGQQPLCVGVLEFVSIVKDTNFSSFDTRICKMKLKDVGLAFRYPSHSEAITQILPYFNFPPPQKTRKGNPDELSFLLNLVIKKYNIPLVQIWSPCICDGSEVSIECEPNSDSFSKVTHLVCALKCLDWNERDERRSVWLSSYRFCDPEVYFLEDGESWVGRAHSLKKICFIKDIRQFSIADYPLVILGHSSDLLPCFAVPLQLVNPKLPPLVLEVFLPTQYSFDADQGAILKGILSTFARELSKCNADFGMIKDEEYSIEISHSEDDYDCVYLDMYHGLPVVEEVDVQHQPNDTEIKDVQHQPNARPCLLPCDKTTAGVRSTLKRKRPSFHERTSSCQRDDVHSAHKIPKLPTISVDSSDDEDQQSGIRYSSSDNSKEEEEEAAVISIPLPPNGKEKSIERGNDAADDSCTLIVRAKYSDDIVRFPFSSNSGIEGLRGDVFKRFELKDGSFKIKYLDDGYWIMLSCSDDLSFHMRTLTSSGQTTMDLSVFAAS